MSPQLRTIRITTEREYSATDRTTKPVARSCDDCRYPVECKRDRLCWVAEKEAIQTERETKPIVWTPELTITAIKIWKAERGRVPTAIEWRQASETHPSYADARKMFGTFGDGLRAAGYAPLGPYGREMPL